MSGAAYLLSSGVASVLTAAAELLSPDGAWTQGHDARRLSDGGFVSACSSEAVCWCAGAAIRREARTATRSPDRASELEQGARKLVERFTDGLPIEAWNDVLGRTHAEVLAVLRAAAELAAKGGAS